MKLFFLSMIMLILTACEGGRSLSLTRPYALDATPPSGSPEFQQGYADGCESALSGMGNQFIKVFHEFKYDTSLANNKVYDRMWNASNDYCRLFLFVGDEQLESNDHKQYDQPVWFWK